MMFRVFWYCQRVHYRHNGADMWLHVNSSQLCCWLWDSTGLISHMCLNLNRKFVGAMRLSLFIYRVLQQCE
jgi:hypothetical protein